MLVGILVFVMMIFSTLCANILVVYSQETQPNTMITQQKDTSSPSSPSSSSSSISSPKLHAVKITSPTKGQQVPAGEDLTIFGSSIDNVNSDCQITVTVNRVKPYQPAASEGTGGANDYSKWNFIVIPKYTTIHLGQNRITAKYTCSNINPAVLSFDSVNVTGVSAPTTARTTPTTANSIFNNNTNIKKSLPVSSTATMIGNRENGSSGKANNNDILGSLANSASSSLSSPSSSVGNLQWREQCRRRQDTRRLIHMERFQSIK